MKAGRMFVFCLALFVAAAALAGESRTYETSLDLAWDAAVKTVRDVEFVLVDSDRDEGHFVMRNRSKLNHKKGYFMEVVLTRSGQTVSIRVVAADPSKAKRTAKHITRYLAALDERLE